MAYMTRSVPVLGLRCNGGTKEGVRKQRGRAPRKGRGSRGGHQGRGEAAEAGGSCVEALA